MKKYFLLLLVLLNACNHKPPQSNPTALDIPEQGNNLYYYLVSELESFQGQNDKSLFYLDKAIGQDPNSSFLAIAKAYELARRNQLDGASDLARKAYAQNPQDPELNILLGKISSTRQKRTEAIRFYQKALEVDPSNEEATNLLAHEYIDAGQAQEAARILEKLVAANPSSVQAWFYLGSLYATQLKDLTKALRAYEAILDIDSDNPKILEIISEIHLARKDYRKAAEVLDRLGEMSPNDLKTRMRVGLIYYEMKDIGRAIEEFEAILKDNPGNDKLFYYLGLLYQEKGDLKKSSDYFSKLVPRSEYFEEGNLRRVMMFKKDSPEEALTLAKNLIATYPRYPSFYDLLSSLYAWQKKYDEAARVLEQGLAKNPNNEGLLVELAVIYDKLSQTQKSMDLMKRVLKVNESNTTALNYIGYTYAEKGEHLDEAEELIQKALAVKPEDGFVIDSLGWVYYQKGDYEKAEVYLHKALKLNPTEPTILEHLGSVALKKSDKKLARKYFELSLAEIRKKKELDEADQKQISRILDQMKLL